MNISKLTALPDGRFVIFINDEIFGEISAHPKARFIITEITDPLTKKSKSTTLEAGTHNYKYKGLNLKIDVKDLQLRFVPVDDDYHNMIGARQSGSTVEAHVAKSNEHNAKAQAELLSRVVVSAA